MLYYALRILAGLLCAMGCLWETVYGDLPSGASASYDRGTYLMKKHRYAEAVEALRVAAESGSPLEVAARLKRARAYWRSDHVTEAQSDLLIALNNVTEELRLRVNSAALYERRALVFVNQSDMLREVPLSQIGCLPDWQTPLQGALNDLNRALELEPLRPAALYMKTSVLTRMYRWKELIEFCKTTLDRAPGDARILIELAVAHLALEEWEPAITRCEEALAVAPDNTAAILLLAEVFERRGDWDGAKEVYTRAIAVELAEYQIRVNCVIPGYIHTERWNTLPEQTRQRRRKNVPLGKESTPEDIGQAAAFFASPMAGNVTGSSLLVSGGIDIQLVPPDCAV